jgi:hypothetical protein
MRPNSEMASVDHELAKLRAEIERLERELAEERAMLCTTMVERLRAKLTEAAAFLDGMADHQLKLVIYRGDYFDGLATDCRTMAEKLRGEK